MSEPTFTVTLTRQQVLEILKDAQAAHFPHIDNSDETVHFFGELRNWWFDNRYAAQYREKGGEWVTTKTGKQVWETAWDGLADEMQRRGMRFSELGGEHGFIGDAVNKQPITAEDGTEFRLLGPKDDDDQ